MWPNACSLLAHSSNINDLLEGLDGVLKDWFDRLHDSESSFHVIDLWLHALNSLHLSGNFDEGLSIVKSLKDSSGQRFLDVFNGSGLSDGGISVSSSLGHLGGREVGSELGEELIIGHVVVSVSSNNGDSEGEFHGKG